MLRNGTTLIIDPIIALTEDQIEVMSNYGIERTASITSNTKPTEQKRLINLIEFGEIQFVLIAPERLQMENFRNSLNSLRKKTLINLAVIDEAHCVSEWGHDFRPAYLNLGKTLKRYGADKSNKVPSILSLTGTASKSVLKDIIADLEVEHENLIKPRSFDRAELNFKVFKTNGDNQAEVALKKIFTKLPKDFESNRNDFFNVNGSETYSGVIFVPFVDANPRSPIHSVSSVSTLAEKTINKDVLIYSGKKLKEIESDEEWKKIKTTNSQKFRENISPLLVATKAFGMGIDKPNIRYTIHMGMPESIENFYQEAGRAGRDRKKAICSIIFSEQDANITDRVLDPSLDYESFKAEYLSKIKSEQSQDDISRRLFFHTGNYPGYKEEVYLARDVIKELGDINNVGSCNISYFNSENNKNNEKNKEKTVVRLIRIGLVDDYIKDYSKRILKVQFNPFNFENVKQE